MEYQIENNKNIAILKLSKPITVYQLQKLKDAFSDVKSQLKQKKNVILDLGAVSYMDALALGILVSFSKELREAGGDVKLVNMNEELKHVLESSHLDKVYESYDNLEAAIKSFS